MSLYLLTHPNSKSLAASGAFYFQRISSKPFIHHCFIEFV
jgi:hypothetical protein